MQLFQTLIFGVFLLFEYHTNSQRAQGLMLYVSAIDTTVIITVNKLLLYHKLTTITIISTIIPCYTILLYQIIIIPYTTYLRVAVYVKFIGARTVNQPLRQHTANILYMYLCAHESLTSEKLLPAFHKC